MEDYEKYMLNYWGKYPNEVEHDYTIDEISELIHNGAMYHITDNLFILYYIKYEWVDIIFYCCDAGSKSLKDVKHILSEHKRFINSFDIPVFTDGIKPMFRRSIISEYDENKKKWRLS